MGILLLPLKNIVTLEITSPDNGHTLTGTMTYVGESPAEIPIVSEDGTVEQFISGGTITFQATIEKTPFYGDVLRIENDYGKGFGTVAVGAFTNQ